MFQKCRATFCMRAATIARDGKYYCWQHDKDRAELEKRISQEEAEVEWLTLMRDSGIDALTTEELLAVIALGGIKAMLEKLTE